MNDFETSLDAKDRDLMERRNIRFTDGFAKIGSKYFDGVKVTVLLELNWMYIEKRYSYSVRVLFDDLTLSRALELADSFLK